MPHHVLVLKRAEQDLQAAADWIAEQSPQAAERWFNAFVAALVSLENNPQRCGLAPENENSSYELRQLIFRPQHGRAYRAVFTIIGDQVRVLRIRGASQDLLSDQNIGS